MEIISLLFYNLIVLNIVFTSYDVTLSNATIYTVCLHSKNIKKICNIIDLVGKLMTIGNFKNI